MVHNEIPISMSQSEATASLSNKRSESVDISNKLLEIQQIEQQQRLITERMVHIQLQKKKLEQYLNLIQSLDTDDEDSD